MTDERSTRFSAWLRAAMAANEMQQADLARRLEVSTGMVSRWYNGKSLPGPANARRLADALGEDRDFVLDLTGYRPLEREPADFDDPRVRFFASKAGSLTEGEWQAVKAIIEQFAKVDN